MIFKKKKQLTIEEKKKAMEGITKNMCGLITSLGDTGVKQALQHDTEVAKYAIGCLEEILKKCNGEKEYNITVEQLARVQDAIDKEKTGLDGSDIYG